MVILKLVPYCFFVDQLHSSCFPFCENIDDTFFEAIVSGRSFGTGKDLLLAKVLKLLSLEAATEFLKKVLTLSNIMIFLSTDAVKLHTDYFPRN